MNRIVGLVDLQCEQRGMIDFLSHFQTCLDMGSQTSKEICVSRKVGLRKIVEDKCDFYPVLANIILEYEIEKLKVIVTCEDRYKREVKDIQIYGEDDIMKCRIEPKYYKDSMMCQCGSHIIVLERFMTSHEHVIRTHKEDNPWLSKMPTISTYSTINGKHSSYVFLPKLSSNGILIFDKRHNRIYAMLDTYIVKFKTYMNGRISIKKIIHIPKIVTPSYLCVTLTENIIVSDQCHHMVTELSQIGEIIRYIGIRDQFTSPKISICDNQDRLWISDHYNGVQIFGKDGKVVCKIEDSPKWGLVLNMQINDDDNIIKITAEKYVSGERTKKKTIYSVSYSDDLSEITINSD